MSKFFYFPQALLFRRLYCFFALKWKIGPRNMGEQGPKSTHHLLNKLGEQYCGMMQNATARLSHTINQHLLEANPDMSSAPEPAQKNRNELQ